MNGVAGPLAIGDAIDIAGMLVRLKRAVPPDQWVDVDPNYAAESAALQSAGLGIA